MRWSACLSPVVLLCVFTPALASSDPREQRRCGECHVREQAEFNRSRMAVAARTPDFLDEWAEKGRPTACLDCHDPGRNGGVTCIDCHGTGGHPYPRMAVPRVCGQCHDAPGESTLRQYWKSPAARKGRDCLDCHLEEDVGHDFRGPSRPGFLQGVARLKIALRRDEGGYTALVRVRHRAGHALPGGTTGRAVWLVVEAVSGEGKPVAKSMFRFGWYHDPEKGWQDRTLPPGPDKVIEVPLPRGEPFRAVRAMLIYRFEPGGLDQPDPRQVVLARVRFELPEQQ